jgi:hypothetical protein
MSVEGLPKSSFQNEKRKRKREEKREIYLVSVEYVTKKSGFKACGSAHNTVRHLD